ncbi:hypothetical protein OQA88_1751 [Cercophora sp. LCS_1]
MANNSRREELKATAKETLERLTVVLDKLKTNTQACSSRKYSSRTLPHLDPNDCPAHPERATIKVVNEDTLNAAIQLMLIDSATEGGNNNNNNNTNTSNATSRPAIVNFANHRHPGGGWQNGAMAQEEAICYRSSLPLSLNPKHYPLAMDEALYSPYVLVVRGDMASGHHLLLDDDDSAAALGALPVVSVLTVAAIYQPPVRTFILNKKTKKEEKGKEGKDKDKEKTAGVDAMDVDEQTQLLEEETQQPGRDKVHVFERDRDRDITKSKMRLALRMAATNGNDLLVLGALGCGVFANPPEDVAHCWLEVLKEHEFRGNWWRQVWFAVYDPKEDGNFEIFDRVLSGKKV